MSDKTEVIQSYNLVYNFNIVDLVKVDDRWDKVWSKFISSCSRPTVIHCQQGVYSSTYDRTINEPPRLILDSIEEFFSFLKKVFCGYSGGSMSNNGWVWHKGKYRRNGAHNSDIYLATKSLEEIFESRLNGELRGNFYYPPKGFREWHTNKYDRHGWRLYLVHTSSSHRHSKSCVVQNSENSGEGISLRDTEFGDVETEPPKQKIERRSEEAFFRYKHPVSNAIHSCVDFDGCLRMFRVSGGGDSLWHAICSECDRWSLGFILSDENAKKMLDLHKELYDHDC